VVVVYADFSASWLAAGFEAADAAALATGGFAAGAGLEVTGDGDAAGADPQAAKRLVAAVRVASSPVSFAMRVMMDVSPRLLDEPTFTP